MELMSRDEMLHLVKSNLKLDDNVRDLIISDIIFLVVEYCNLGSKINKRLEPFIRKKVGNIIAYEKDGKDMFTKDISSIKEGDSSVTYSSDTITKATDIYGLSDFDKALLNKFRKIRRNEYR